MDEFYESRPEFSGFNAYYRDTIFPDLIAKDMVRRQKVKEAYMWGGAVAALTAIGIVGLMIAGLGQFSHFVGIGGLIGAFVIGASRLGGVKSETKQILVGNICKFVGWTFRPDNFAPIPLEPFRLYGLLPKKSDRVSYEDMMEGVAHGAQFRLHEAHLEVENRSDKGPRYRTQFRGVLIQMGFPRKFMGTTIVLRDKGIFNAKQKSGLKRVGLVDPVFEKAFEAYGDDQVEARYLLTPTFMQQLVDLEALFQGKKIRAIFSGGQLSIVFDAPNQFEAGSMFKPLTDPDRTHKILKEISMIFDIVDGVLGPQSSASSTARGRI